MMSFKDMLHCRGIFVALKWYYQRATRGWADCDVWNWENYITHIMIGGLERLKNVHAGHPPTITEKEWEETLNEMVCGFRAYLLTDADDVYILDIHRKIRYNRKLSNARYKRFQGAMKLLAKWYPNLWD